MNSKKLLCAIASVFWIAALQAAFFWIANRDIQCMITVYCFYTVLSLGHVALLFVLEDKLGVHASIAPALVGSVIAIGQEVMSLCFLFFDISSRRALFAEMIVLFAYIAIVSLVTSAAYGDSSQQGRDRVPVRSFDDNPPRTLFTADPCHDAMSHAPVYTPASGISGQRQPRIHQ